MIHRNSSITKSQQVLRRWFPLTTLALTDRRRYQQRYRLNLTVVVQSTLCRALLYIVHTIVNVLAYTLAASTPGTIS